MVSPADLEVARRTLKIKSSTYMLSFVSVLWRGEVIMCCFNNITKEMSNIFCFQSLDENDVFELEKLINDNILLDKVV